MCFHGRTRGVRVRRIPVGARVPRTRRDVLVGLLVHPGARLDPRLHECRPVRLGRRRRGPAVHAGFGQRDDPRLAALPRPVAHLRDLPHGNLESDPRQGPGRRTSPARPSALRRDAGRPPRAVRDARPLERDGGLLFPAPRSPARSRHAPLSEAPAALPGVPSRRPPRRMPRLRRIRPRSRDGSRSSPSRTSSPSR